MTITKNHSRNARAFEFCHRMTLVAEGSLRLALIGALTAAAGVAQTAGLAGVVRSDQGLIVGARTSAVRLVALYRGAANPRTTTTSAADGTFRFDRLQAGTYQICVDVPSTNFLDPCEWGNPDSISLVNDQTLTGVVVTLTRGATVEVRVDDSKRLLRDKEKPGGTPFLIVGVRTDDQLFHPAQNAVDAQDARTYSLVVPFDTSLTLLIRHYGIVLEDDGAKEVAEVDTLIPLRIPAGTADKVIRYKVKTVAE